MNLALCSEIKRLAAVILIPTAFIGLVASAADASEVRYTAKVYDTENRTELLYNYKSEGEMVGNQYHVTNTFTAPDGKVAMIEHIHFNTDKTASYYDIEQKQLDAFGKVEVINGEAKFSYKKDGKEKSDSEKIGADFITTSAIPLDLEANWAKIMKGEKLKRRLAVVDRMETVGFEFSKEKEVDLNGKKSVVVKMKPSSFIIAAIVKPLHFYMSMDGTSLYQIDGRTTVKKNVNGSYKDLDAITIYTKGVTGGLPTAPAAGQPSGGNSK
ncbi:MAG: hypothetical protein EOP05_14005 [Proteobacteria bacterium]|nr:MAG: hypothetical protein EOP05_14005 [Pseudomonadota bacterium]